MATTPRLTIQVLTKINDFGILHRMAKSNAPEFQKIPALVWMFAESRSEIHDAGRQKNELATRMLYIYGLAKAAFGDEKLAKKFLTHKHSKLRTTPLAKLDTEWGGREVEKILQSIIHGLPS